jgi:hypothetical protein
MKFEVFSCHQGSDEESDVDDEEREVEAYDRQLADAEYESLVHLLFGPPGHGTRGMTLFCQVLSRTQKP